MTIFVTSRKNRRLDGGASKRRGSCRNFGDVVIFLPILFYRNSRRLSIERLRISEGANYIMLLHNAKHVCINLGRSFLQLILN